MFKFPGTRPSNLGVKEGKLAPTPTTPNCVHSQSDDKQYQIAPLPFVSIAQIKEAVNSMERTEIIEESDNYLYVEFTTKLMGFVDDVEFHRDEAANVVHVRSASRLGKSDLDLNRQRVEAIRAKLS